MDATGRHLALLQRKLRHWIETIKRATGARSVELAPGPGASFRLEARWDDGGAVRSHTRLFTRAQVEADGARRACDHARDFIAEILAARGVLP